MGRLTRRAFLRTCGAAAGAGLLAPRWARGQPAPAPAPAPAPVPAPAPAAPPAGSRVVCVTDGRLWAGPGWTDADLDRAVARDMIARGLIELTGAGDAVAALGALIPSIGDPAQRYAIKVNAVNPLLPSHPAVVGALVALLTEAGASAERVVVFDREDGELARAGFVVGDGPGAAVRGRARDRPRVSRPTIEHWCNSRSADCNTLREGCRYAVAGGGTVAW